MQYLYMMNRMFLCYIFINLVTQKEIYSFVTRKLYAENWCYYICTVCFNCNVWLAVFVSALQLEILVARVAYVKIAKILMQKEQVRFVINYIYIIMINNTNSQSSLRDTQVVLGNSNTSQLCFICEQTTLHFPQCFSSRRNRTRNKSVFTTIRRKTC